MRYASRPSGASSGWRSSASSGQASLGGGGPRGPAPSRGPATNALYVPVALAEKITGEPATIRCINVALNEGADAESFRRRWNERLRQEGVAAAVIDPTDVKEDMEQGFSAARVRNQAYAATGISLLAALFIILTTLSMGVDERIRQLAMLRAVALTRGQVAAMIAVEGLVLAVVGWLGGLAAGWGLLRVMAHVKPDLFAGGATLGTWAVALSAACAFGGALLASIPPAWRATRVSPLEAMAPRPATRAHRRLTGVGPRGTGSDCRQSALGLRRADGRRVALWDLRRAGVRRAWPSDSCSWLRWPSSSPSGSSPRRWPSLLRLDRRLLGTQLASNLWRTLGTTVALTLGLGLFVAMQTWGYSMLEPFVPGDWAPDVLVCFPHGGLPDAEIDAVARIEGVDPQRCLPLAVEQPKLADDITGSREHQNVARQDNVIMIGLDPERALGGEDPMLDAEFVEGNREDAIERLQHGRGCVVPDHFARATGLSIGDRFALMPPEGPQEPVEYTIAGVVSLPGWHWMTKFSGLRRRSGRSAALVFASRDNVRRDFDLDETNFFWFDTRPGADLDRDRRRAANRSPIATRASSSRSTPRARGTFAATMFGSTVRITTADQIRQRINARADSMIWGMSELPLVTLLGHVAGRGQHRDGVGPRAAVGDGRDAGGRADPIRPVPDDPGRGALDRPGRVRAEPRLRRHGRLVRHGHLAVRQLLRRHGHAAGDPLGEARRWASASRCCCAWPPPLGPPWPPAAASRWRCCKPAGCRCSGVGRGRRMSARLCHPDSRRTASTAAIATDRRSRTTGRRMPPLQMALKPVHRRRRRPSVALHGPSETRSDGTSAPNCFRHGG